LGKYKLILADPPWRYNDQGTRLSPSYNGPQRKKGPVYPTMTLEDICAMGEWVKSLADEDAILLLWSMHPIKFTHPMAVIKAWGFSYSTAIPWIKARWDNSLQRFVYHVSGGHSIRSCSEKLLVCLKGKISRLRLDKGIPGAIIAPRPPARKGGIIHSAKPDAQYDIAERLVGIEAPKIELFARYQRPGWDAWGDEVAVF